MEISLGFTIFCILLFFGNQLFARYAPTHRLWFPTHSLYRLLPSGQTKFECIFTSDRKFQELKQEIRKAEEKLKLTEDQILYNSEVLSGQSETVKKLMHYMARRGMLDAAMNLEANRMFEASNQVIACRDAAYPEKRTPINNFHYDEIYEARHLWNP